MSCINCPLSLILYFSGVGDPSKCYSFTTKSQRKFLSWQTWDLLRIMVYGFLGFCENFLSEHPGYAIYPVRLNGSAVETIFSQLKNITGSNLMASNYASARAALLTKKTVTKRTTDSDYREAPLFIREHKLKSSRPLK